jgi:hypothetical protein
MERIEDQRELDTIDLGSATAETKGPIGVLGDENGRHPQAGISDE